jgi:hypothetical protein
MKIKMKVLDSFRIFGWVGNLLRLLSAHVFVASLELYTMLGCIFCLDAGACPRRSMVFPRIGRLRSRP